MTSVKHRAKPAPRASPVARAVGGATLEQALQKAVHLLRGEQIEAAEAALQALLARWPEQPDALHFLGVLRFTQNRHDEGIALVQRSLALVPGNGGAWNNLGNILLTAKRVDEAQHAYEQSVQAGVGRPESADPLNNLSVLHRKQGRPAEAEAASRAALALRPESGDLWFNLSLALISQGKVEEGLLANSRAVAHTPRHLQGRNQVIRTLLALGHRDMAAQLYRDWLAEEPDNPVAQHQLAACLGDNAPERASDAYVEEVFDSFAASFDIKLEQLQYRAPQLVAEAVQRALGAPRGALQVADLGCGTGLCGPLLRPYAQRLVGCDLSAGMLRQAKPRQVYDALHKAELVYYMDTQPQAFDLMVSADTLCYFGELQAALGAAMRALRPGGWLVFTVEALPEDDTAPHRLQPNGRYAHHQRYLSSALHAAGLRVHGIEPVALRMEAGKPVAGWLVSAHKS